MKRLFFCLFLLALLSGCHVEQDIQSQSNAPDSTMKEPLEGAWELVYAKYGLPDEPIEIEQPDDPIQLKIFSDGHYAHVMQNQDGSFLSASAGTYVVEGDHYTETTYWSSTPENIGSITTFTFRIDGDSLFMSGPVEIVDANGEKVEEFQQMEEIRRRAK